MDGELIDIALEKPARSPDLDTHDFFLWKQNDSQSETFWNLT